MGGRGEKSGEYIRELWLTDEDKQHIVDTHRSGTRLSQKTEFPSSWNDETILAAVEKTIARPDGVDWPVGTNDRIGLYRTIDGITVYVGYSIVQGTAQFRCAYPLP